MQHLRRSLLRLVLPSGSADAACSAAVSTWARAATVPVASSSQQVNSVMEPAWHERTSRPTSTSSAGVNSSVSNFSASAPAWSHQALRFMASAGKAAGKGGSKASPAAQASSTTSSKPSVAGAALLGTQAVALPPAPFQKALQPSKQRLLAKYTPWTPTRLLVAKRKPSRRMNFLISSLEEEQVRLSQAAKQLPDFSAGDVLEVRMVVPEVQRKEYTFRGVCIGRYNKGIRSSFKIYNVFPETGGLVQHIPLHMPDLLSIRVVGRIHARRAKLTYLLQKEMQSSTFQTEVQPPSS